MLEGRRWTVRTGSEPVTARSALRMRLWLSLWGTLWALFGLVAFALSGRPGWAVACGVVLVVAVLDLGVIAHRMRQGPHHQPGRDVPPYEPDHGNGGPRRTGPPSERRSGDTP
ncbi:DUF6343 family protein [Streptomyces sp. NPDC049916]|uniref:DUF6343 family protein n=1 Tax=Streptomyces sp. NPDC049916 TaxID=3155156 RepID=UPI00343A4BD2